MKFRHRFTLLSTACLLVLTHALVRPADAAEPPMNVVVFLVDDMGWTDLGCQGSDLYSTPNIDQLAAKGMRFTNGYAACTVCSPTRAAYLTGQYPARLRVTDFIPGHEIDNLPLNIPDWTQRLEHDEITLAEMLQSAGYRTAHLGKWHLTNRDRTAKGNSTGHYPDQYPEKHGFDINIGGNEHGAPPSYFWPYGRGKTLAERKNNPILRTLPPSDNDRPEEYLTDRIAEEGVRLIEEFSKGPDSAPFFTSFCFYNVHTPLQAPPTDINEYKRKIEASHPENHTNPIYAAMVTSVDRAVGKVVGALEENDIADNTLILFTSDNGGLRPQATDNAPLRQGKGGIYEGGVRVPFIVYWPGVTTAGSTSDVPVISMDILPTVMQASGLEVPAEAAEKMDGLSLAPLLRDPSTSTGAFGRDAIYWHYPHYHSMGARPYSAVRAGDWKLIQLHDQMDSPELYHLARDIHEDHNLATGNKGKVFELAAMLDDWRASVDAQMPSTNPDYDAGRPTGRAGKDGKVRPMTELRE